MGYHDEVGGWREEFQMCSTNSNSHDITQHNTRFSQALYQAKRILTGGSLVVVTTMIDVATIRFNADYKHISSRFVPWLGVETQVREK